MFHLFFFLPPCQRVDRTEKSLTVKLILLIWRLSTRQLPKRNDVDRATSSQDATKTRHSNTDPGGGGGHGPRQSRGLVLDDVIPSLKVRTRSSRYRGTVSWNPPAGHTASHALSTGMRTHASSSAPLRNANTSVGDPPRVRKAASTPSVSPAPWPPALLLAYSRGVL